MLSADSLHKVPRRRAFAYRKTPQSAVSRMLWVEIVAVRGSIAAAARDAAMMPHLSRHR